MSKPFNPALNADIKKLHEFPKSTRRHEYKLLFSDIMKRHNISRATVYAELAKETPGKYRRPDLRSRRVRISKTEMDLVAGYIVGHKPNPEICRLMSVEMGFSYTSSRLMQVKDKLAAASKAILNTEPKIIKVMHKGTKVSTGQLSAEKETTAAQTAAGAAPFHGYNTEFIDAREFFYKLAAIDLNDRKAIICLNFWGKEYKVSARIIRACLDHIAASASSGGRDIAEYAKFEIESLLIQQLRNGIYNSYFKPGELQQLTSVMVSLIKIYSHPAASGGYSLEDVYRVVQHFSPNVDREEIAKLLGS